MAGSLRSGRVKTYTLFTPHFFPPTPSAHTSPRSLTRPSHPICWRYVRSELREDLSTLADFLLSLLELARRIRIILQSDYTCESDGSNETTGTIGEALRESRVACARLPAVLDAS